MEFFKQLTGIAGNIDLNLRIMSKGDSITVSILPATTDKIQPLTVTGSAEELDNAFMDAIRKPLGLVAGLNTNADEFEASVTKELTKPTNKPKADAKPADKKTTPAKESKPAVAETKPTIPETKTEESEPVDLFTRINECSTHDALTKLATAHQERFDKIPSLQESYNAKRRELAVADPIAEGQQALASEQKLAGNAPAPAIPKPGPPRPAPLPA